jgi:hypothetical protein
MRIRCTAVVALIVASTVAGAEPPPGWEERKIGDGLIRVLVPKGQQSQQDSNTQTINGVKTKVDFTLVGGDDAAFGIVHTENPKDALKGKDPQKVITQIRAAALQQFQARIVSDKKITFGEKKYPGREYVAEGIHDGERMRIRARLYLIENHGVVLYSVGSPTKFPDADTEQFFKSFEWNPPADDKPKSDSDKKK